MKRIISIIFTAVIIISLCACSAGKSWSQSDFEFRGVTKVYTLEDNSCIEFDDTDAYIYKLAGANGDYDEIDEALHTSRGIMCGSDLSQVVSAYSISNGCAIWEIGANNEDAALSEYDGSVPDVSPDGGYRCLYFGYKYTDNSYSALNNKELKAVFNYSAELKTLGETVFICIEASDEQKVSYLTFSRFNGYDLYIDNLCDKTAD